MRTLRSCSVVGMVLVAAALLLPSLSIMASAETVQPEPSEPGAPAPEIEKAYLASQADASLTVEARVRSAVDTYFELKYRSIVDGKAYELGIVIDTSTASGQNLRNYELGRLQYSLAQWRRQGSTYDKYNYRPEYERVQIKANEGIVQIRPWVDLTYGVTFEAGGEPHLIRLINNANRWMLIEDIYSDEFTDTYPLGIDFAELIAALEQESPPSTIPMGPPPTATPGDASTPPTEPGRSLEMSFFLISGSLLLLISGLLIGVRMLRAGRHAKDVP